MKRHLIVDTLGLIPAVVVHAANVQDRDGGNWSWHEWADVSIG